MTDGSTITANSREEVREAFKAYKEANPEADLDPELQFPISVTLQDGTIVEVGDEDGLEDLEETCEDDRD